MIEFIVDRWLTWRTGLKKSDREFHKWFEETVVKNASTIENMFMNFKFIIPVSTQIFDHNEPFGWVSNKDFQQYLYPNRAIGDCAVYYFARGYRDRWDGRFYINDISCDQDQVFVATNNERDAIMIALRWS